MEEQIPMACPPNKIILREVGLVRNSGIRKVEVLSWGIISRIKLKEETKKLISRRKRRRRGRGRRRNRSPWLNSKKLLSLFPFSFFHPLRKGFKRIDEEREKRREKKKER